MTKSAASQPLTGHLPVTGEEGIDPELWYACAGPHKTLPPVYSEVAYFPQGHIEQVASFNNQDVDGHIPHYNLPAVILCSLNDIQLSADPESDEVFATLTLCPLSESVDDLSKRDDPDVGPNRKPNSFTKTLTVSDTSTHGGFSVPRRAAEECFPPLDKSQDPPTQDLVAKDLHGNDWKFRHIFRGTPKRHLLTSGWSHFVSQKRLVAGDSVLFLRSENGQLRIGVRRSPRQRQKSKVLTSPTMTIGVLAAAAHAASEKSRFSLIYNPRSCPSEFVIPFRKYLNAMKCNYDVGQRFKLKFESEETYDRRYTGTITGITDYDSERWPKSAWRSLQVNWDESSPSDRQERISPWEVGPFTGCTTLPPQAGTRKRQRPPCQLYTADYDLGLKDLRSVMDVGRSQQEQHNERTNNGLDLGASSILSSPRPSVQRQSINDADLQLRMSAQITLDEEGAKSSSLLSPAASSSQQRSLATSFSEDCGNGWLPSRRPRPEVIGSAASFGRSLGTALSMNNLPPLESGSSSHPSTPKSSFWENHVEPESEPERNHDSTLARCDPKCKIFGVPLHQPAPPVNTSHVPGTRGFGNADDVIQDSRIANTSRTMIHSATVAAANKGGSELGKPGPRCKGTQHWLQTPVRSYTKVHKQGAIGRSIDVTKYGGYPELLQDVQEMFGLDGELFDKNSGWQLVYTDHEDDVLLVGDDPWVEFCSCVRSIRVLSPGEAASAGNLSSAQFGENGKPTRNEDSTRKDGSKLKFRDKNPILL